MVVMVDMGLDMVASGMALVWVMVAIMGASVMADLVLMVLATEDMVASTRNDDHGDR